MQFDVCECLKVITHQHGVYLARRAVGNYARGSRTEDDRLLSPSGISTGWTRVRTPRL